MMIVGIMVLGVATAFLELSIYLKTPFLQSLIRKYEFMGYVFSLFLAVVLGHLFGATGVMAATGGVLAMSLTQPVYWYLNQGHKLVDTQIKEIQKFWDNGGVIAWFCNSHPKQKAKVDTKTWQQSLH